MQQQTLSLFGVRKDVQTMSGRWLREQSPEYMREGLPCTICGQRFKSKQGMMSHKKHVHNEERPETKDDPHWAWRFLQGAQPHADGEEPVVVPAKRSQPHADATDMMPESHRKRKKRCEVETRCGAETRVRYTAIEKLHAVDHYMFARESGLVANEAVFQSYKKRVRVCDGLHFLTMIELSRKRVVIVRVFVS